MALSKSKKHFVGLTWADGDKKGGLATQCDKNEYRGILAGLEGITGKNVDSDAMTVKNSHRADLPRRRQRHCSTRSESAPFKKAKDGSQILVLHSKIKIPVDSPVVLAAFYLSPTGGTA